MTTLQPSLSERAVPALLAAAVTVIVVSPLYLTGAAGPEVRSAISQGIGSFGVALGAFSLAQIAVGLHVGRWVDRVGAFQGMEAALGLACAALLIIGLADRWLLLAGGMLVCGSASALAQTSCSRLLARTSVPSRRGLDFGIFQSAKPVTAMLSGLVVAGAILVGNWRMAFILMALVAIGMILAFRWSWRQRTLQLPQVRRLRSGTDSGSYSSPESAGVPDQDPPRWCFFTLAAAATAVFALGLILPLFLVDSARTAGFSSGRAALVLSVGSFLAILARLGSGYAADRSPKPLAIVAMMLAAGSLAMAFLATQARPLFALAGILSLTLVWGYTGAFFFAIVALWPSRPGSASGGIIAAGAVGGVIGPAVAGLTVSSAGYQALWYGAGAVGLAAAAAIQVVSRAVTISPVPEGTT